MLFTRRRILASGAALAALGAGGWQLTALPEPGAGRLALSDDELVLVEALGEAMFPAGNPIGVGAVGLGMGGLVDELLGDLLDPMVGPVFRHILHALDAGTLASRGARFVALPLDARVDVLAHWDDSALYPRRAAYDALRLVMGMAFFNTPEVRAKIGWRARCELGAT